MKISRSALSCLGAALSAFALLCACSKIPGLERMMRPQTAVSEPGSMSIDELKAGIERYSTEAERRKLAKEADLAIAAADKLGVYHMTLASKYIERKMYRDAYDVLVLASSIYPDDSSIFYNAGFCGAYIAKSMAIQGAKGNAERDRWFQVSEASYRRAIEIKPLYTDALYGLSVLYSFELARPADAEPLLRRLLQSQTRNADAMLLLARVYYQLGRYEDAANLYETAAKTTVIPEKKKAAEENRAQAIRRIEGKGDGK